MRTPKCTPAHEAGLSGPLMLVQIADCSGVNAGSTRLELATSGVTG